MTFPSVKVKPLFSNSRTLSPTETSLAYLNKIMFQHILIYLIYEILLYLLKIESV